MTRKKIATSSKKKKGAASPERVEGEPFFQGDSKAKPAV